VSAAEEDVVHNLFAGLERGSRLDEQWKRQRLAAQIFAEDAVYREDPRWPGAGVYRGPDEIVACWINYLDVFEEPVLAVERIEPLGEQMLVDVGFRSRVGEMPVEHRWSYVVELRDGLVARLDAYLDRSDALAAAR
jgi:ketosteroid isomerase-like protein